MKKILAFSLIVVLLLSGGCGADNGSISEHTEEYNVEGFVFNDIEFENREIIDSFAVMDDNRTALLYGKSDTAKRCFGIYENSALTAEKEIPAAYCTICYDSGENCFYAFNSIEKEIHKMDENFDYISTVSEEPQAFEIKSMDIIDGRLYYIICTKNQYDLDVQLEALDEKTGYMDFGEAAYSLDTKSGEKKTLDIKNVICQSVSGGKLYYYTHGSGGYCLNEYNRENERLDLLRSVQDTGYVSCFALCGEKLYFMRQGDSAISEMDMKTGSILYIFGDTSAIKSSDFKVYKSEPIVLNREDMSIRGLKGIQRTDSGLLEYSGESLVIGYYSKFYFPIDLKKLGEDTGITAKIFEYPIYDDEIKLKLLSGDSDVDIYIFSTNRRIGRDMRTMRCYEPITNTGILSELEASFDWAADYSAADNGDIWCMPICTNQQALFYLPENLERLGIEVSELTGFDGFFSALEKLSADGRYGFYSVTQNFADTMTASYNINHSFFDFDNDIFRNMFTRIYSDWVLWSNPAEGKSENPLFSNIYQTKAKTPISAENAAVVFDSVEMFRSDISDSEKWYAAGLPRLSDSEEKYPVSIEFAVINPCSKKKAAAEAYLGYIAENRFMYRLKKSFLYKDLALYDDSFDKSAAYFEGLYALSENSAVFEALLEIKDGYLEDVIAYQKGENTLDEYISALERASEMTAKE